jgi:hypothetical protein
MISIISQIIGTLYIFSTFIETTLAASMDVHSIIGRRAIDYYGGVSLESIQPSANDLNSIIRTHEHAILGGADFPDFLYACGKFSDHYDAAEASHWPIFQAAAISYIRSLPEFNQGNVSMWPPKIRNLTAFIFGVTVHYVTDELWEGLTTQLLYSGMIELVDGLNLGMELTKYPDKKEMIGNEAADFYASWILKQTNISPWDRFFPVEDLVNIYHMLPEKNYGPGTGNFTNVTLKSLANCKIVFDLGLWATQSFGALLFPLQARKMYHLPFVAEHVFDQPLSGLEDMAAMTSLAWNRIGSWLDKGPPPFSKIPLKTKEADAASDEDDISTHTLLKSLQPFIKHVPKLMKISPSLVQEYFQVFEEENAIYYQGPSEHKIMLTEILSVFTKVKMGIEVQFIKNLAPVKKDSSIEALQSPPPPSTLTSTDADVFSGTDAVSYLGSQIVHGDFNSDGYEDICYSSYGTGSKGISSQRGSVHCKFGSQSNSVPDQNSVEILGDGYRSRFGYSMEVLDFNLDGIDDLIVSAPGFNNFNTTVNGSSPYPDTAYPSFHLFGRVYILFGHHTRPFPSSVDETIPSSQMSIVSTKVSLRGLGWKLMKGDINNDGNDDILVGCPLDEHNQGRLFGIKSTKLPLPNYDVDIQGVAYLDLVGPKRNTTNVVTEWFGYSAMTTKIKNQTLLLVGSPFYNIGIRTNNTMQVVGGVHAYWTSTLNENNGPILPFMTIVGEEHLEQFGYAIKKLTSGKIAISAPDAGSGRNSAVFKWPSRSGRVSILNENIFLNANTSTTLINIQNIKNTATIRGSVPYGRFGTAIEFLNNLLVVGAAFQDTDTLSFNGREMGKVFAFNKVLNTSVTANVAAAWSFVGKRSGARCGSSIAILNDSIHGIRFAIGSPLAEINNKERVGVVDVLQIKLN